MICALGGQEYFIFKRETLRERIEAYNRIDDIKASNSRGWDDPTFLFYQTVMDNLKSAIPKIISDAPQEHKVFRQVTVRRLKRGEQEFYERTKEAIMNDIIKIFGDFFAIHVDIQGHLCTCHYSKGDYIYLTKDGKPHEDIFQENRKNGQFTLVHNNLNSKEAAFIAKVIKRGLSQWLENIPEKGFSEDDRKIKFYHLAKNEHELYLKTKKNLEFKIMGLFGVLSRIHVEVIDCTCHGGKDWIYLSWDGNQHHDTFKRYAHLTNS